MKKEFMLMTVTILIGLMLFSGQAVAEPSVNLTNWGSEVNPGQCTDGGKLVLNITHNVINDLDSGEAGNFWAISEYNRHIQVFKTDETTFCAVVRYMGSFVTRDGRSPGNTDDIAAGIEGTFEGGYRAVITGSLNASPSYRTRGNIGTFDYDFRNTPWNWIDEYFIAGSIFNYSWWGWNYQGGNNGKWVNSADGNEGDITD